jgi:AraC-like DNA-binding protein
MNNKTASVSLIKRLVYSLLQIGISWKDITQYTGIIESELIVADGRISGLQHYRLLSLLNLRSKNLAWAVNGNNFINHLFFSKDTVLKIFSEDNYSFLVLCLSCESIYDALTYYIRYRGLIANLDEVAITIGTEQSFIDFRYEYPEFNCNFVSVINFIFIKSIIDTYTENTEILKISTTLSFDANLALIFKYWGFNVKWSEKEDRMHIDNDVIYRKNKNYNPLIFLLSKQRVETDYQNVLCDNSFSHQVEIIVGRHIDNNEIQYNESVVMDEICSRFSSGRSTVYRRLASENTNFRVIETKVRLEKSIYLLKGTSRSLSEISQALGFSSQSSFNRFFTEKMGISPNRFRVGYKA